MTTKFSFFLLEGLIKLPHDLSTRAEEIFVKQAIAFVAYHGLQGTKGADERRYVLATIKQVAESENIDVPSLAEIARIGRTKKLTTRLPVGQLAERYASQLKQKYGDDPKTSKGISVKDLKVKLTIAFTEHKKVAPERGGVHDSGRSDSRENEVIISLPHLGLKISPDGVDFNAVKIRRKIKTGLGTLEHELTHEIQLSVLGLLHPDQVETEVTRHGQSEWDKASSYYVSQIEFDPMVKSAIRRFRLNVENIDARADFKKTRDLFDTWVEKSSFLLHLRDVSVPKWKKAIKLIWTEYQKRYM